MTTTVDESGGPGEFVTSGLSTEEVHGLTSCLPDGLRLFEYLRDQEAALWVDDFPAHIRSPGLSEEMALCRTFQGTPMRHRGARAGNFYVGDKEGGEGFTDGDEELPVFFASRAAGAVANARASRRCATSSRNSAGSPAATPHGPPSSTTCAASATRCPGRARGSRSDTDPAGCAGV